MAARKTTKSDAQLSFGDPPKTPTPSPDGVPRLYLVDASAYVYRAFHAIPFLSTTRGVPTNAA